MGMGMSVSPQIWQQFIDLVFQDDLIKPEQNFDTFIHSTKEEHIDDFMDLFEVLCKYGFKISPHKCQFFKKKMGSEFQVKDSEVCYTPLKDKCDAIRNLESPKTLKQTSILQYGYSSLFYDLQKKAKKFKWTDESEKVLKDIKELLISPPVLKAPTPDGLLRPESNTSHEGVGGTLLQKQGD